MSVVFQHDFTAADNTDVVFVAPTVGTNNMVAVAGALFVTSNRARRGTTSASATYRTNDTLPSADYQVICNNAQLVATGTGTNLSLNARFTDTNNRYRLTYQSATNDFIIVSHKSGTSAQIGAAVSWTPSAGTDYDIVFEVSGSSTVTLRGLVDGVEVISRTDSSSPITSAANAALVISGSTGENGATTGWAVDQFVVDTLGSATTPRRPTFLRAVRRVVQRYTPTRIISGVTKIEGDSPVVPPGTGGIIKWITYYFKSRRR